MFANNDIERVVLEIYTNDICREFYFVNSSSILKTLDEDDAVWLSKLDKIACQRHSDCLRLKIMDDVFNNFLNINTYSPQYMGKVFRKFYLCHKMIPGEPFSEYCIRFGEFYQRHHMHESEMIYITQIISYCLCKLIVERYEFPNFFLTVPENWSDYKFNIPPYVKIKTFDYDIKDCFQKIKANLKPVKKECTYLFASLGGKTKIIKISQDLAQLLSMDPKGQSISQTLASLVTCVSSENYSAIEAALLLLVKQKYLLLDEPSC